MGKQMEKSTADTLVKVFDDVKVRYDLADSEELQKMRMRVENVDRVLGAIKNGLPKHLRLRTNTQYIGVDAPTIVYKRQPTGQWQEVGKLVTGGGHKEFLGTGGFVNESGVLVITDSHSGYGITACRAVELVNLKQDPHRGTLGGASQERHEEALEYIRDANDLTKTTVFDCSWY